MWIKKVSTTPLNAIAKVIDSLSGGSTVNAPSIHAVSVGLEAIDPKMTWSSSVSCLVGDTTCTITDASILTTSVIEPFAENASGDVIAVTNIAVTTGQAVLTFGALEEATSFKLRISNP